MGRSRASAKQAGSRFERAVADYLAATVDDRIDRRTKTGARDRGDIGGVRVRGERVVIECKDAARLSLGVWASEAQTEAANDGAAIGVVVHKRHGRGAPGDQWVSMTLADFAWLLGAEPRPAAILATVDAPEPPSST